MVILEIIGGLAVGITIVMGIHWILTNVHINKG